MDLRDFIGLCEKEGDLKRVTAEVDWDLEMTHIAKLVEEKDGRAVLFENIKGHDSPVFFGAYSSTKRLALALGKPTHLSMTKISHEWMKMSIGEVKRAKEVSDGPIFENIIDGDDVDVPYPVGRNAQTRLVAVEAEAIFFRDQ